MNYETIKSKLRKYSFQYLKVSEEPVEMLEYLHEEYPEVIESARNPDLLAAALVYIYVKKEGLGGRGGITGKKIGEYFGVSAAAISQKVFDIDYIFEEIDDDIFALSEETWDEEIEEEFIDKDRYEVTETYWNFLESKKADDAKKSIIELKKIIEKDPDFYDPYISLYEYYMDEGNTKLAFETMQKGYSRAMKRLAPQGIFPDRLSWGYIENRHIIRLLFNTATMLWATGMTLNALSILMQLLYSNTDDNIGARYAIVALLEGYETYEDLEEKFDMGEGLDIIMLDDWFHTHVMKHKEFIGWWMELVEEV